MSSLFILLFSSLTHVSLDQNVKIVKSDISYLNDFVSSLDSLVDSAISSSTTIILDNLVDQSPVYNVSSAFSSCFVNSTFFNGSSIVNCSPSLNISFIHIFNDIIFDIARKVYKIDGSLSLLNYSFEQVSSYAVKTSVVCLINVTHRDAKWVRLINTSQVVSLIGITDPLSESTSFTRSFKIRPVAFSNLFDVSDFKDNYSLVQMYIDGSYYFQDNSSPSFLDMLEGNLPLNSSGYFFNKFGISSFVPDSISYPDNKTSFLEEHYVNNFVFSPDDLRRINFTNISTNFSLPVFYLSNFMNFSLSDPEFLNVSGCCNSSGCDPSCG